MLDTLLKETLISLAVKVSLNAYAPYSNYRVGAALLTDQGDIYTGCNVENASYGLACCAERTAVFNALSDGKKQFNAIAVVTSNGFYPCGACRQVLGEFNPSLKILIANSAGKLLTETTLDQLLPHAFTFSLDT